MEESKTSVDVRSVVWPIAIFATALVLGIAAYLSSPERTVAQHYENAANAWMQGESLYKHSMKTGHGFLYLPQAAILHVPYASINNWTHSETAGDIVWRLVSWTVLALASLQFVRGVSDQPRIVLWRAALIISIMGLSSLKIGQSTAIMTGLILMSVDAWRTERFNFASLWVVLAIAIKPLAIVPALLLFAVSSPMRGRLLLGGLAVALLPFLTQSPSYAAAQYADCLAMMKTASELGNNFEWAQLFGMLNVFGVQTDPTVQKVLRMIAAVGVLALVWIATRTLDRNRQAVWLFSFAAVYLMLFNPRNENSTYCLLGPVFGLFVGQRMARRPSVSLRDHLVSAGLLVAAILSACSFEIGKNFTPEGFKAIWLAPLCCTVLAVFLLSEFIAEVVASRELATKKVGLTDSHLSQAPNAGLTSN